MGSRHQHAVFDGPRGRKNTSWRPGAEDHVEIGRGYYDHRPRRGRIALMKRTLLLNFVFAALAFAPFLLAQNRTDSLKTFGDGSTIDAAGARIPAGWPLYVTAGTTAGMNGGSTVRDQARTTLSKLQQNIANAGFSLNDVAFVRAYVVPDSTGKADFAGWDEAWREVFGNAKTPRKPARTTLAVPRLGTPETVIEIEFVCSAPANDFSSSDKLGLPVANPVLKPYGTKEAG